MWKYKIEVSEELKQGGFDFDLGKNYHYIKIGATNVGQLSQSGIIPKKKYQNLQKNKPDGLILSNKNSVIALVEYKKLGKVNSIKNALKCISDWYYELANILNCKVICVSDGNNTYWIHALTKRLLKDSENEILRKVFDVSKITYAISSEEKQEFVDFFNKFNFINENGVIEPETILNPQVLANNVWQKIWISTGKEPEKCLYNVVEIFIFKFLSDLGVLDKDYSFYKIYSKSIENKDDALEYYAKNVRDKIRKMFPESSLDRTTVINGTIFVNEDGEPNFAQSSLFKSVLQQFADYDKEYGSFRNIDKNFKTRLYESFLRQSAGISVLGQYFTPRNVVNAIIKMINEDTIPEKAVIGDPFCGVGGFLLELLNEYPKLKQQYEPKKGKIDPKITLIGYDKGSDEKDDQRTIILAKANMLIYFSDLLVKYNDSTKLFANDVFNKVFQLIKTNLGTLGIDNKDYFDIILSNPPYVTSGVSTIKKEITEQGLKHIYLSDGNGLEGLSLEWIIYSLKPGGRAFVVIPDGLLSRQGDLKLRNRVMETCKINAIISLPTRTFFATPKSTYILSITKNEDGDRKLQQTPVFTYLISEIGETRDAKRFEIAENDLIEMVKLYKQFMASPNDFETNELRCRIQPISRFKNKHWLIDRDWNDEEKKELGILEETMEITEDEFYKMIEDISHIINNFKRDGF